MLAVGGVWLRDLPAIARGGEKTEGYFFFQEFFWARKDEKKKNSSQFFRSRASARAGLAPTTLPTASLELGVPGDADQIIPSRPFG